MTTNYLTKLEKLLTFQEKKAVHVLFTYLNKNPTKPVIVNTLAKNNQVPGSAFITAIRLLEAAGILEKNGRGMRGTQIQILNQIAFEYLAHLEITPIE